MVHASVAEGSSVSKQYEPDISQEQFGAISKQRFYLDARLGSHRPLTEEERAAIPENLSLLVGRTRKGKVPAVLGWSVGPFVVNQRVRDILEELEPGVHSFYPIAVKAKDGEQIEGRSALPYFIILHPPALDCVDPDRTTFGTSGIGLDAMMRAPHLGTGPDKTITLKGSVIAGHHFWRGAEPLQHYFFGSDELKKRLEAEKLKGWDFGKKCRVSDALQMRT
jgi:hypothetical protein